MIRNALILACCAVLASTGPTPAAATQPGPGLPMQVLPLDDLSSFRPVAGNWRLAAEATVDPSRPQRLRAAAGSGVLVNLPGGGARDNLFTAWEHGDLELELEFMMPKGSNSGVYLQGRYEIQLLDSWGVKSPAFSDAGGVYQRWDPARGPGNEGFEGQPPRINAARAPGLWQRLEIRFQAPRFDAQGRKIANARFVRVALNGAVIHQNVEVTGPTRAAAYADERPAGPLMVQGDHGPVALRNIRYRRYSGASVRVSDLSFRAYEGDFRSVDQVTAARVTRQGRADGISTTLAGVDDRYGLAFEGTLEIPAAGRYQFDLGFEWADNDPHFQGVVIGGGRLVIGGREVLVHSGLQPNAVAEVELPAGRHPFSFVFFKNRPWTNRLGMTLYVEAPEIQRHPLHLALARAPSFAPPVLVEPTTEPMVLRGFVKHGGEKRTHTVAVGDPSGVHFSYDLRQGAVLSAWRGPFVEATEMWSGRGTHQLAEPLGSVLTLAGAPAVARLADAQAAWPDSVGERDGYRFEGYALDPAGRPTFLYALAGARVQDRIRPAEDGGSLHRQLSVEAPASEPGVWVRIAEGREIRALSDGSFAIDDFRYYVRPDRGSPRPVVRRTGERQELLLPVQTRGGAATLGYTITW